MTRRGLGALLTVLAYSATILHLTWAGITYFGQVTLELDASSGSELVVRNLGGRNVTVVRVYVGSEPVEVAQSVAPGDLLRLPLAGEAVRIFVVTDAGEWVLSAGGKRVVTNRLTSQSALVVLAVWTLFPPLVVFLWEFFKGVRGVAVPYLLTYWPTAAVSTWLGGMWAAASPVTSSLVGSAVALTLSEVVRKRVLSPRGELKRG